MLAKDLGRVSYLSAQETRELLELKQKWGFTDPRLDKSMENCDICANDVFRSSWGNAGVNRKAFDAPPPMGPSSQHPSPAAAAGVDYEMIIKTVTEQVCRELGISAA